MRILCFLAVFLWSSVAWGLELVIDDGPFEVKDIVVIRVVSDESLGETRLHYSPTKSAHVLRGYGANDEPVIWFYTKMPGDYQVSLQVAKPGLDDIAKVEFQVGEEGPNPNPQPNPEPTPTPTPGKKDFLILHETNNRPPPLVMMRLRLYLTEQKHNWDWADEQRKGADNEKPKYIATALQQVKEKGLSLPVLVVAERGFLVHGDSEDVFSVVELPDDPDKAIEIIKEWD
jgi:hypothetical protein